MNKAELLKILQEKSRQWEEFLDQIDPSRMERPGVNGAWSMKDMLAHLTAWNRWLVVRLVAAQRGEPQPLPPWPPHLKSDDEINAWIYETNRMRSLNEVREESRQIMQELYKVIESLTDDVRIERIEQEYYLVWVGDVRFEASEYFDHFRDDHEPDVRAWLGRGQ